MVTKKPHFNWQRKKIFSFFLLSFFISFFCFSQESTTEEQIPKKNYFTHNQGEEILIYQTIQWKPGNLVKYYTVKLEILTEKNEWLPYEAKLAPKEFLMQQNTTLGNENTEAELKEVSEASIHETEYIGEGLYKTTDTKLTVALFAKENGLSQKYRYTITLFNILGHPAFTTEPMEFEVRKAHIPQITDISKEIIYLDSLFDGDITIRGENLMETSQFYLIDGLRRLDPISVKVNSAETRADIVFDQERFDVGNWILHAENPGEFKAEIPLVIRFIKWYDLNLSLGYAPQIVIYDNTIKDYFGTRFIPLALDFRLSFYPIKRRYGYFGFGLGIKANRLSANYDSYNLTSNFLTGTVLGLYRLPLIQRKLYVEFRGGGGVTLVQGLQFKFPHNLKSENFNSLYFAAQAGGSVAYTIWNGLYVEAGLDLTASFIPEMPMIALSPSIGVGWSF